MIFEYFFQRILQKRFAARLGVSVPTYQKLESGSSTVNIGLCVSALELLERSSDLDSLLAENESLFEKFDARNSKKRKRATGRNLKND